MRPWVSTANDADSSRSDLEAVCKSGCASISQREMSPIGRGTLAALQMRDTLRRADPTCLFLLRRDLRGLSTMRAKTRRGVLGRLEGHRRDPPQRSTAEVEAGLAGWDPMQVSGQARRSLHRSDAFDYAGWVNAHAPTGGACNGTERAAARYTSEGDRWYAPSVAHGVQSRDDLSVWRGAPGARRCP